MRSISVVIPTYNRISLLKEAVNSVRAQTSRPREIIVVDDGSQDETVFWCKSQNDVLIIECKRGGPSKARNMGAALCSSEWIAFLDSDDVWLPDHLETLSKILEDSRNSRWIVSNAIITDSHLSPVVGVQGFPAAFPVFKGSLKRFNKLFKHHPADFYWRGDGRCQALLGNWMQPSGLLIRKGDFLNLGGFNENLIRCEDMDLLLRLVKNFEATVSLRPTYLWRQGQSDSLASDQYSLHLKRQAISVLFKSGYHIAMMSLFFAWNWLQSLLHHIVDFLISSLLRTLAKHEDKPSIQALLQTSVAFLNLLTPFLLSRLHSISDFSQYKTFGLYLSSATSLSFTAGFWSLLPFWRSKSGPGEKNISVAFKLDLIFSLIFSVVVLFFWPLGIESGKIYENLLLFISIFFLLPSVFLEQNLAFSGHALLVSSVVCFLDILKFFFVAALALVHPNVSLIFVVIACLIALRFFTLLYGNIRFNTLNFSESINVLSAGLVLRQAFPVCLASALAMLSFTFDRFFLSHVLLNESLAIVLAGFIPIPFVGYLEQSVYQRVIPVLASSISEGRTDFASDVLAKAIRQVSDIVVPMTVVVALFSSDIVWLLYDHRYKQTQIFLAIYSLLNLSACIPLDLVARAQGKSSRIFYLNVISCIVVCSAVVVGYLWFSELGAVIGSVCLGLIMRLAGFFVELRRYGIDVKNFSLKAFHFRTQGLFFAFATLLYVLSQTFRFHHLLSITVACIIFSVFTFKTGLKRKCRMQK